MMDESGFRVAKVGTQPPAQAPGVAHFPEV